jgi:hypothetical protein
MVGEAASAKLAKSFWISFQPTKNLGPRSKIKAYEAAIARFLCFSSKYFDAA